MCCTTLINRFKIRKKEISRIIDNNTDFPLHFLIYIVINDLENNLKRYPLDKFNLPGSTIGSKTTRDDFHEDRGKEYYYAYLSRCISIFRRSIKKV